MLTAVSIRNAHDAAVQWNWRGFQGSLDAIRYAKRELTNVDKALSYVRPEDRGLVVQAGGCLGIFPKYLAQFFGRVLTFEPDPQNFINLRLNVLERNVTAFPVALGATAGPVLLSRDRRDGKTNTHDGIVHVAAHLDGPGAVQMIRLDSVELPRLDLLYLDTEGCELEALQGSVNTITVFRPVIAVEVNKNLQHVGLTEADVMRWFQTQCYTYVAQAGSDRIFVPMERGVCH